MSLPIHENIKNKLEYFYSIHKIPNIIFNGPSGSGKSTIVNDFVSLIYEGDKDKIKNFVMYVNFAKTHINSNGGNTFKSIILLNGDKLTMDAQSALRRCIELFSHNTRFFIIVEDKYKLLKPILSRFCEIYVSEPEYKGKPINLYKYNLDETFKLTNVKQTKTEWLKKELLKPITPETNLIAFSTKLYEKGYSALDVIKLLEDSSNFQLEDLKRYELLVAFNKVRTEFRNEKLLILFLLNFVFLDIETNLDNISFM